MKVLLQTVENELLKERFESNKQSLNENKTFMVFGSVRGNFEIKLVLNVVVIE